MAPICGPRYLCTVSNKCLKSLELLKKSLISIKANIRESSLFDGYKMRLNMEALLQSNQVKRTPQESINEFIIQKLNPLLVVDFRSISAFLYV